MWPATGMREQNQQSAASDLRGLEHSQITTDKHRHTETHTHTDRQTDRQTDRRRESRAAVRRHQWNMSMSNSHNVTMSVSKLNTRSIAHTQTNRHGMNRSMLVLYAIMPSVSIDNWRCHTLCMQPVCQRHESVIVSSVSRSSCLLVSAVHWRRRRVVAVNTNKRQRCQSIHTAQ